MTNAWTDFNDVKQTSNLIPKGTIVKVRMTLRPGGFDDPSQGWTGGYAKRGTSGSVYLDAEYTVLEGQYPGVVKTDCVILDFGTSSLIHGSLEQDIDLKGSAQGRRRLCDPRHCRRARTGPRIRSAADASHPR